MPRLLPFRVRGFGDSGPVAQYAVSPQPAGNAVARQQQGLCQLVKFPHSEHLSTERLPSDPVLRLLLMALRAFSGMARLNDFLEPLKEIRQERDLRISRTSQ